MSDEAIKALLDYQTEHGALPHAAVIEVIQTGCSPAEAIARSNEWDRINALAAQVETRPVSEWPPFEVKWDLTPANYYRVLDGVAADTDLGSTLILHYPLHVLDAHFSSYNRRTAAEVWGVGNNTKAARAIVFWSEGGLMTPPFIVPVSDQEIGISGGNHRLAVARAKGVTNVPILVRETDRERVIAILGPPND